MAASATIPYGTSIALFLRVGKTATPDGTWSSWTPASDAASLPRTKYAQVAIAFTSAVWDLSPSVFSATLAYMPGAGGT